MIIDRNVTKYGDFDVLYFLETLAIPHYACNHDDGKLLKCATQEIKRLRKIVESINRSY